MTQLRSDSGLGIGPPRIPGEGHADRPAVHQIDDERLFVDTNGFDPFDYPQFTGCKTAFLASARGGSQNFADAPAPSTWMWGGSVGSWL
jgi:hypothetical protein